MLRSAHSFKGRSGVLGLQGLPLQGLLFCCMCTVHVMYTVHICLRASSSDSYICRQRTFFKNVPRRPITHCCRTYWTLTIQQPLS